ncbi:MAG: hypothetical protein ACI30R_07875 [Sodaliphilus sp.]
MTASFDIELFDGHLIFANNEQLILVDTGSPVSISRSSELNFMDRQHRVTNNLNGNTIDSFSEFLQKDIDVLLGMDIMAAYSVRVDYAGKKISFSTEEFSTEGFSAIKMGNLLGCIFIPLSVGQKALNFALDTGAKISYIARAYTSGETAIETRNDFSPLIGRFTTPIYQTTANIHGTPFPVKFGEMQPLFENLLRMMNVEGIIGYDLFAQFTIILNFPKSTLHFRPSPQ